MNLIENMMEDYCFVDRTRIPDGAGGFQSVWTDSEPFKCSVTLDSTIEARKAEHDGMTSVYTVTASRNIVFEYRDVIKRLKDGKIFRITSDSADKKTPDMSAINGGRGITQATAESWVLT